MRVEPLLSGAKEPGVAGTNDALENKRVEGDGRDAAFRRGAGTERDQPIGSAFPAVFPALLPGCTVRPLQPIEDEPDAQPAPRCAVLVVILYGVADHARFHGG